MSTTIVMPQLGESVAEGVIGKWLKNEGDPIEKDEPIVEVITDKVNAEIPSPVAGVLEKITQPEGATVAVGQEIAVIGSGGGNREDVVAASAPLSSSESTPPPAGGNGRQAEEAPALAAQAPGSGSGGRADRVRSSPLVRRLAEQHGINLAQVPGTGIGGRVSKQDILAFVEHRQQTATATLERPQAAVETVERPAPAQAGVAPAQASPAAQQQPSPRPPQPAAPRQPAPSDELIPLSPLRKMIADRMVQSVYTIPHAMTMSEVDVTPVVRYRESKKDAFREREGMPLSYVAFVIKAVVEALKDYPLVNAEWGGDHIIRKGEININVAVDAPEGLITPVIHHADDRSLAGLSKAVNDLATRARGRKLRVDDMQGGTFTVNNTGALGSTGGFSIINYPQAGILSAAAIVKRPVVLSRDGEDVIAVRSMMNLSFSFDHRLLDGGYAAGFVEAVKRTLEHWPQDYPLY